MSAQLTKREKNEKFWGEVKDLLIGAAFPFVIMIVFSTSIIMFASFDDLAIQIIATVGGEALLVVAFVIFGRQNGASAYRKFVLHERKRALNSSDKKSIYKTGEYALWKGFVIPLIVTVPFLVFQIVNLCSPNSFTEFILLYACGWAYFPLSFFGAHQAYNFILIALPVGVHAAGYAAGKRKEEAIQKKIEEENAKLSKKRKK